MVCLLHIKWQTHELSEKKRKEKEKKWVSNVFAFSRFRVFVRFRGCPTFLGVQRFLCVFFENDLKEATTKLQQYLTGRMVTKQLQFGHFDKDLSEVPENKSSNGNAVTH
jgi:hypothetical protein